MSPMKSKKFVKSYVKAKAKAKVKTVNLVYPANSEEDALYLTISGEICYKQYNVICWIKYKDPDYGICHAYEEVYIVTSSPKNIPELAKKQITSFGKNWAKYKDKSPTLEKIIDVYVRLKLESCGENF